MYWPGWSNPDLRSLSQARSSISGGGSTTAFCAVVNSEARTNSVPPQLGHVGSSSAASSDRGNSQSVHRKVPVPATFPDIQAFMPSPSYGLRQLRRSIDGAAPANGLNVIIALKPKPG